MIKPETDGFPQLARFVLGFRHQSKVFCPDHHHEDMELVYHVSGEGFTSLSDGQVFPFSRDTLIINWPGVFHNQTMTKSGEDACVILSVTDLDWLPQNRIGLCINALNDSYLQSEFLRLASTPQPKHSQSSVLDLRATALLIELLERGLNPSKTEGSATIRRLVGLAHTYIQENFRELGSVNDVADYVGLSSDYLRHLFRDHYGMSMKKLLLQVRIDQAKLLLDHTSLPQKQVAEECGFANVRYFSTSFRKMTGMTPGKYRNC